MSTLTDNDVFLIQQNGETKTVLNKNRSTLDPDNDIFLVQRSGVTHTIKAGDVGGGGGGDLSQVNLAPLSGTPEFVVTATTNLSEILPESTINYKWYRYTASTGGTGTLLQELTSDSVILDTYETVAADQGNYIGCTVTYLGVTVVETARTQCLVAPGPVATMSGLRFDALRLTDLTRTMTVPSTWTLSMWVKLTSAADLDLFTQASGARVMARGDGTYYYNGFSTPQCFTLNEWHHVVLAVDGDTFTFFVNGVVISSASSSSNYTNALTYIGSSPNATAYNRGGYLSEVYFAEEVLPPTAFGKTFEPYGWGPLDSSQIIENINNAPQPSPYDTRANTDEVWSSQVTPADANTANVFNGDATTGSVNSDFNWTTSIPNVETLEIYTQAASLNPASYSTLTVNGVDVSSDLVSGNGYNTISNPPSTLTNITATYNGTSSKIDIYSIKVNGRLLVDQGVWNNSQNWSDTSPASTAASFDNNLTTYASIPQNTIYYFSTLITFTDKVEVRFINSTASWQCAAKLQGSSAANFVDSPGDTNPVTIASGGGVLEGWQMQLGAASYPIGVAMFIVDGAILVDSGAKWNTSQVWSDNVVGAVNPAGAFNGSNTEVEASSASTDIVFTPNLGTGSFEVVVVANDISSSPNNTVTIDGTDLTAGAGSSSRQFTGTVSSFNMMTISSASGKANFKSVTVDGALLVDKASFGANGFYLPFDPTAAGVNYSSNVDVTPTVTPWANIFKGLSTDGTYSVQTGSETSTTTFSADTPVGSGVRVAGGAGKTITFGMADGSTKVHTFTGYALAAVPEVTSGSIRSLTIGPNTAMSGIEVNGVLLVDHNSIGVDESGNENNFLDQNFGVGNTSQVWSTSITNMGTSTYPVSDAFNYSKNSLAGLSSSSIDSAKSEYAYMDDNTTSVLDNINIPVTSTVSVLGIPNEANAFTCAVEATDGTSAQITGWTNANILLLPTSALAGKTLKKVTFTTVQSGFYFGGIVADGNWLIDTNQQDTVTDTPLMNYAVLETGTNGNLSNASGVNDVRATVQITEKAYYEVLVNDIGAGFIIGVSNKDTGGTHSDGDYLALDQRGWLYSAAGGPTDIGLTAFDVGDVIGVAYDSTDLKWYVNGALLHTESTASFPAPLYAFHHNNSGSVSYDFGQQPFAASNVTYDQATGVVTVDGVPYNTLFQTWEQTKATLLNARIEGDEERINELESILIRQAVPFDRDTQYPKGTIVNMRGQLFEALVDEADVSLEDFVASFFRQTVPEWENLNIETTYEKKQGSRS